MKYLVLSVILIGGFFFFDSMNNSGYKPFLGSSIRELPIELQQPATANIVTPRNNDRILGFKTDSAGEISLILYNDS